MTEREFIYQFTTSIRAEGLKTFPHKFITNGEKRELKLPGKILVLGEQFFGKQEIITVDGTSVMHADNYSEAKYIVYAGKSKPASIKIPIIEKEIKFSVAAYEKYLDTIVRRAETEFKKKFPDSKNLNSAINEIFRILNLVRY